MIQSIAQVLAYAMQMIHKVVPDWGLSIVLLTLLVRGLIWPLTRAQAESMKKMQALQPELKELEVKYKDDPERKGQEILRIYTANKVNPLAGCIPVVIQMPVLIGMFVALRDPLFTKQLPGFDAASFLGMRLMVKPLEVNPFPEIETLPGMLDLSSVFHLPALMDRFLYLPALPLFVLYIISTYFYSKQMQTQATAADPNQKMMSQMMLFMLLYFGLLFPNGLLLYFVMSNMTQMLQQWLTPKAVAVHPTETVVETVAVEKKPKAPRKRAEIIDAEPEK
ncbi:MAG: YidC/Oxa1 family membrane protein insertase [bacterium]